MVIINKNKFIKLKLLQNNFFLILIKFISNNNIGKIGVSHLFSAV
jgi:hypothetical protein